MNDLRTTSPDELPELSEVPEDARAVVFSPNGPLQALPYEKLLTKLISTNLAKPTKAAVDADLAHPADSVALVFGDPTPGVNGWYRKLGDSGAGSWQQFEELARNSRIAAEAASALAVEAAENAELAAEQAALAASEVTVESIIGNIGDLPELTVIDGVEFIAVNVGGLPHKLSLINLAGYLGAEPPPPPVGSVIEAEIMGTSGLPVIAGNIPSNGKILRIRFKGIGASAVFDPTKATLTVTRPGYGTDRVLRADNVVETLTLTGLYRRPFPDGSSKLMEVVGEDIDTYWAPSASVFEDDVVSNLVVEAGFFGDCIDSGRPIVINSSTRPYEMPQVDLVAAGFRQRLGGDGLSFEWAVMHHGARWAQTVAAIECYVVDDTANPGTANRQTVAVNAMTASAKLTPYTPPVFAGSFANSTGLTNGLGGMSVKVYPWIGNAPWDLADHGEDDIRHTNVPKFFPVVIDGDNSYATARAYISHTGSAIGSPTFTTGALSAYDPGTTPAFATVLAALTAGQAWNNNAANRARVHNDAAALELVLPNGTIIAGFGGAISAFNSGNGTLPRLTSAAGADPETTGISAAVTSSHKQYRHLELDRVTLFPSSGAGHIIMDGTGAGASVSAPADWASTVLTSIRNCPAASAGDTNNPMFFRAGHCWLINNSFANPLVPVALHTNHQSVVIHGGTYDASYSATPIQLAGITRILGADTRQYVLEAENAARTIYPYTTEFYGWSVYAWNVVTSGACNIGSNARPLGARGVAFVGNLVRVCRTGGATPAFQIHADYTSGADKLAIRNVNLFGNTIVGDRSNLLYIEVGANTDIKEAYEFFNAHQQWNNKGDYMDPDGGGVLAANGARTGNLAFRFGTDRGWNRVANTAAFVPSSGPIYAPDSWLGEAAARGNVVNIGNANMYEVDTSAVGTNTLANPGDYRPKAALRNAIPSGRAPWRNDLTGTLIPSDGTGAAGAQQVTA